MKVEECVSDVNTTPPVSTVNSVKMDSTVQRVWSPMLKGAAANPMGVDLFAMMFGLGFVLSFGYWTTNFAEVQRALSAKNLNAGRMTPIIGAFPKTGLVRPEDITATIFQCLGLSPDTVLHDPQGRPFPLSRGRVLHEILV